MTPEQRVDVAIEFARQAKAKLATWSEEPDTVAQRRLQVQAAILFRHASDVLDDQGRLTE